MSPPSVRTSSGNLTGPPNVDNMYNIVIIIMTNAER